jgi:hypothetical protein
MRVPCAHDVYMGKHELAHELTRMTRSCRARWDEISPGVWWDGLVPVEEKGETG